MTNSITQTFEGQFTEGGDFRVLAAPHGLDREALLDDGAVTNFDVNAYDLSATRPDTTVFTSPGNDPSALNINGVDPYFVSALSTANGWRTNAQGWSFQYDVSSALWSSVVGGHVYGVEFTFHTVSNGKIILFGQMTCRGARSE